MPERVVKPITGVDLGFYPWVDNGHPDLAAHMTKDQAVLDAFAREYREHTQQPAMEDFLLTWLPTRLFDIGYAGAAAPKDFDLSADEGIKRAYWLAHVIGWNVGVFARVGFRLGEVPPLATATITPEGLSGTLAAADRARVAATGSESDVLSFNLESLYGPMEAGPIPPAPAFASVGPALALGEVPWYGYDLGFIKSLTTTNRPEVVPADPDFVTYSGGTSPSALLDAQWKTGDAPFLAWARKQFDALGSAPAAVQTRLARALNNPQEPNEPTKQLVAVQDRYTEQGKMIWSGPPFPGPNVTTFSVANYHYFLNSSVYYVQYNQANAMAALAAYATQDPSVGRREAALSGVFQFLIDNSMNGAFDPRSDAPPTMAETLPTFV